MVVFQNSSEVHLESNCETSVSEQHPPKVQRIEASRVELEHIFCVLK